MYNASEITMSFKPCELFTLIPREKLDYLFAHSNASAEIDATFLGFEEVYKAALAKVSKDKIILDLGCAYATQSYYFRDYAGYIGVDMAMNKDSVIHTENAKFYFTSIQSFLRDIFPTLGIKKEDVFAICSYVPDKEAKELVKTTFPSHLVYYPGEENEPEIEAYMQRVREEKSAPVTGK